MSQPPAEWKTEQRKLRAKLQLSHPNLTNFDPDYIIGIDISLHKGTNVGVCTGILYHIYDSEHIDTETCDVVITQPYFAGYLAFREVAFYANVYHNLIKRHPEIHKDNLVVMTDGNGILHPFGFGLASHLGVLIDTYTIGIGKNLHQYEDLECNHRELKAKMESDSLSEMDIRSNDGSLVGYAVKGPNNTNPIFLSQGHMVTAYDVLRITKLVLYKREPEPIRLADRVSREHLRNNPLKTNTMC
jgi:deoxyinosine 3'endonuclease (endonuclease V)